MQASILEGPLVANSELITMAHALLEKGAFIGAHTVSKVNVQYIQFMKINGQEI